MSMVDGKTRPPLKRTSQCSFAFRLFLISLLHTGDLYFKSQKSRPLSKIQVWTHSYLQTSGSDPCCGSKDPKDLWEITDVDVGCGKR